MSVGKAAACLLTLTLLLPGVTACSQEPVIPRVAPRPADTLVMLPDGSTVHVELATNNAQRDYGLMGRHLLPQGRGMLFVYQQPGEYAFWMYHCFISLDIVWMDAQHRIVEMSPDTPPCRGKAATCPAYGGHVASQYVLELPEGSIRAHHLALGEAVHFAPGKF